MIPQWTTLSYLFVCIWQARMNISALPEFHISGIRSTAWFVLSCKKRGDMKVGRTESPWVSAGSLIAVRLMWSPKLKLRSYKLLLTVWNTMDRLNCLTGTLNKAAIRKWALAVGLFSLEDSDRVTPGHSGMRWRDGTTRNNVLASLWTPAQLDLLSFQLRVEAGVARACTGEFLYNT